MRGQSGRLLLQWRYVALYSSIARYNHKMSNKNNFTYRKRLNTQIITKTELALQAIKRYDMEQSRVNFSQFNPFNPKTLLNELDNDYCRLTPHRKIQLEHTYKLNLFAYSQEFYVLEMFNYIFPMRVLVKNVKNQGTLYIGYDKEYPGIHQKNKMAIFDNENGDNEKNYDFKMAINRDMLITLKNKGNQMVKNVYFTFIAGTSLLMLDFKVQFLGFVRDNRVMSEIKFEDIGKMSLKQRIMTEEAFPTLERSRTDAERNHKEFSRSKLPQKLNKLDRPIRIEDFQVMSKHQLPKHNSKSTLSPRVIELSPASPAINMKGSTTNFNISKVKSVALLKNSKMMGLKGEKSEKSDLDVKLEQARRNKEMLQVYKLKDKQLKETASKCKRMIESYQKVYNEENVRKRRLNKDIVLMINSLLFVQRLSQATQLRHKKENMQFKINYLCRKFIRKLKKAYAETCSMLPYKQKRFLFDGTALIGFQTKIIYKTEISNASKIALATINTLLPRILINNAFNTASKYRASLRLIQRTWKSKYHGRIYCLLYFIDNHVERMMKDFPHLQMFQQQLYKTNSHRKLCLDYIKDQSQKYRLIYEDYKRQLEEIEEMMSLSKSTVKGKEGRTKKLTIPKRPIKPMHRFYRNLDILKSMVRTWFEIEYKKFIKKSTTFPKNK